MSDNKVALVLFDIGFIAMLISMITGPFGITDWSLTSAAAACLLALAAIFLAFQNLDYRQHSNAAHSKSNINVTEKVESTSKLASNR